MDTLTAEPDGHKLSLAALLAVNPAGAREGNFRLVLAGTEDVSVRLPITDFIPHKSMEGFTVVGQFQPGGQIVMQPNSTATSWVDFRELVASQDVDIYNQDGELAAEDLLAAMDQHRSGRATLGAAWRWMTAVADNGLSLELQLQALPCSPASLAASPILRQDNVATIVLAKFSIQASSFNGKECAGPIPILFSTDPEEATELVSDPATAHEYCQGSSELFLYQVPGGGTKKRVFSLAGNSGERGGDRGGGKGFKK
jgi:hypothetical protein